ncbi:MAG: hypothetical protein HC869_04550 [Rhodospirillales bacterium]|nr:hypothetical protein [Rhodospirillales bacterium]
MAKLLARRARLEAERDGVSSLTLPVGFASVSHLAQPFAVSEQRMLNARRAAVHNQKDQLAQKIGQLRHEVTGLTLRRKSKVREIELIRKELGLVEGLHRRQLTNETRLIALQRELARFEGENASLIAEIAKFETQVSEVRLQMVAIDRATSLEVEKELGEVEFELGQLVGQLSMAEQSTLALRPAERTDGMNHAVKLDAPANLMPRGPARNTPSDPDENVEVRHCEKKCVRYERLRVARQRGSPRELTEGSRPSRRKPYHRSTMKNPMDKAARSFTRTIERLLPLRF